MQRGQTTLGTVERILVERPCTTRGLHHPRDVSLGVRSRKLLVARRPRVAPHEVTFRQASFYAPNCRCVTFGTFRMPVRSFVLLKQ